MRSLPPDSYYINVKIYGKDIKFPDITPSFVFTSGNEIRKNRTFVPIRFLLLNWPEGAYKVTGPVNNVYTFINEDGSRKFDIKPSGDISLITYNGSPTSSNLYNLLYNGTTYIQLKAFCDLVDDILTWDKASNLATITKKPGKVVTEEKKPEEKKPEETIEFGGSVNIEKKIKKDENDYIAKIWDGNNKDNTNDKKFEPFFYGDSNGEKAKLRKKGFDINIVYGGAIQTLLELNKYKNRKNKGDTNASDSFNQYKNNTVRAIRQVYLRSVGQEFDASGNPIYEHYEFIARDIDS